jgi:zinc carboxypeptidase
MSRCRVTTLFLVLANALVLPLPLTAQRPQGASRDPGAGIPSPASVLGYQPGADRHLPTWKQIIDYFTALDKASPRVSVRTLGKTTLGRPFVVAFISDSATLRNLEHYRQIQRKLMDPRLQAPGERQRLLEEGKNIILITSSIHSTEVGGFTTPLVIAERLARGETPEAKSILANTIIMLVPSQNPDGVDIVGDWYRSTLGTKAEGLQPPELYHHYTGHDNNRDWYAFTQVETQYTVDSLYTPWDPEIVNDVHQQGANAGRIFIPPYMDPVEPNIDPILTAGTNSLGMAMSWRMIADGFTGVATNASYDQWSPARQYSLYHRGVRILTETASARLASPIELTFAQLGPGRGYDARDATWNYPALWTGGTWRYGDIVRYQVNATWAMLAQAARDRRAWLESYAALGDRALQDQAKAPAWGVDAWPSAFIIPTAQPDEAALRRLLWTLQHGQVEVREATAPITVGSATYPTGSYVVLTQQPFGGFAKSVLERQHYPDLREYPNGPPKRPYDVTAQTLPLLFGIDIAEVPGAAPAVGAPIAPVTQKQLSVPGLTASSRRIGVYRSYNASMDEGWTRFVFDTYHVPYTSIVDRDIRAGHLASRFDVIVIPDERPNAIEHGLGGNYPDSLRGGLGDAGAQALAEFVQAGGTLVTFNNASEYAIDALKLPVRNVLAGVRSTDFYAPGSLLAVDVRRDHPIARGFVAHVPAVWFEESPAFEITDSTQATAVASYPVSGNPLLSGWLLGGNKLNGRAALVDVKRGAGHVVLFGFRPQYRAQSVATYPLVWGALGGLSR